MIHQRNVLGYRPTTLARAAVFTIVIGACSESGGDSPQAAATHLYMDVHEIGPGKVTADAVAKAHTADLAVQARRGVRFVNYWVDEQQGKVYCLSHAPDPTAIVETHREAHGLLPTSVALVSQGE